jgi:hypothetical protein
VAASEVVLEVIGTPVVARPAPRGACPRKMRRGRAAR